LILTRLMNLFRGYAKVQLIPTHSQSTHGRPSLHDE
jgi:hypothetical protein